MAEETVLSPSTLGCLHPYPIQNTCWSFFTILPKWHHWRVDLHTPKQISQYLRSTLNRLTNACPSKINGSHYPGARVWRMSALGEFRCDLAGDGSPASALPAALYYLAWADKRSAPTKGRSPSASLSPRKVKLRSQSKDFWSTTFQLDELEMQDPGLKCKFGHLGLLRSKIH